MNLEGKVPESWACIDCGVNPAPRLLNRKQMEQDFAVFGSNKTTIKSSMNCRRFTLSGQKSGKPRACSRWAVVCALVALKGGLAGC